MSYHISFQVLFDALGCLRKYETPQDILKEFFELRLERYAIRKAWLEGMLTAESDKLNSQARFILEKIEGVIVLGKGLPENNSLLTRKAWCKTVPSKDVVPKFCI